MKNLLTLYLLILILACLGCTSHPRPNSLNKLSSEEVEAYNSNPNNTDKIVCKTESAIGTRIPNRVCRKESSIEVRSLRDQRAIERIQSDATHTTLKTE